MFPSKMYSNQLIVKIVADSQLQIDESLQFYFALLFYPLVFEMLKVEYKKVDFKMEPLHSHGHL